MHVCNATHFYLSCESAAHVMRLLCNHTQCNYNGIGTEQTVMTIIDSSRLHWHYIHHAIIAIAFVQTNSLLMCSRTRFTFFCRSVQLRRLS